MGQLIFIAIILTKIVQPAKQARFSLTRKPNLCNCYQPMAPMNIVIDKMIAFVGSADTETLRRGIADAREKHDLYTLEIVRLLE